VYERRSIWMTILECPPNRHLCPLTIKSKQNHGDDFGLLLCRLKAHFLPPTTFTTPQLSTKPNAPLWERHGSKLHLLIWWGYVSKCMLVRSSAHHPHSWWYLAQRGESLPPQIAPTAAVRLRSRAIGRQRQLISIASSVSSFPSVADTMGRLRNAHLQQNKKTGWAAYDESDMDWTNQLTVHGLTMCIWLPAHHLASDFTSFHRRGALQCKPFHTTINILATRLHTFIARNNLKHKKRTQSFYQFVRQKGSGNIYDTSTTISISH
jgi:hypothetical protein